jgi:hypothetical protein
MFKSPSIPQEELLMRLLRESNVFDRIFSRYWKGLRKQWENKKAQAGSVSDQKADEKLDEPPKRGFQRLLFDVKMSELFGRLLQSVGARLGTSNNNPDTWEVEWANMLAGRLVFAGYRKGNDIFNDGMISYSICIQFNCRGIKYTASAFQLQYSQNPTQPSPTSRTSAPRALSAFSPPTS